MILPNNEVFGALQNISIGNFKTSEVHVLFFFFLFPMFKKLDISIIYKAIILIFSVNLPIVFIYKFRNEMTGRVDTFWRIWENFKTFFFLSFSKFKKLNILFIIYNAIIIVFSVNLPMVNIYKFWNFDPTTWRTSITIFRWRSTQKVRATQNFFKDKMTGRVDILRCI